MSINVRGRATGNLRVTGGAHKRVQDAGSQPLNTVPHAVLTATTILFHCHSRTVSFTTLMNCTRNI